MVAWSQGIPTGHVWCLVWNTLYPKCMCPIYDFPFMMWLPIPCCSGMHSPSSTTGSWRKIGANTFQGSQRSWEGRTVVTSEQQTQFVAMWDKLSQKKLTSDCAARKEKVLNGLFFNRKEHMAIMHLYATVLPLHKSYVLLFETKDWAYISV